MKNFDINAGGLIGALVCSGIAAAIIFSIFDTTDGSRGPFKLIIFALVGGAVAGNFLWSFIFKKD